MYVHFHIEYKQCVLRNFYFLFPCEIDSDIKVLEDQFDEIIVDIATKRKQYPRKILECVIKTIKAKQEILVRRFTVKIVNFMLHLFYYTKKIKV